MFTKLSSDILLLSVQLLGGTSSSESCSITRKTEPLEDAVIPRIKKNFIRKESEQQSNML